MTVRSRDSERTREAIIDALERILTREGFTGVGVNALAREAGVGETPLRRGFSFKLSFTPFWERTDEICG